MTDQQKELHTRALEQAKKIVNDIHYHAPEIRDADLTVMIYHALMYFAKSLGRPDTYASDWIITRHGHQFDVAYPNPDKVQLEDIAEVLAKECRFGGHCVAIYSVAEHSIMMSKFVSDKNKLAALFHDATEAYLRDIPKPIKQLLPRYKMLEDGVWKAIAKKFDLPIELPDEIKEMDGRLLVTEKRDIIADPGGAWKVDELFEPLPDVKIVQHTSYDWKLVADKFIVRYYELISGDEE